MKNPFVSVIIPTFNDSKSLVQCLKALEDQTYPPRCYEIIVVDNGSQENIVELAKKYPHVKTAHEKKPGSYSARNRGLLMAQGEIFAFTDSDCIPDRQWLANGVVHLLKKPDCGMVGGRIKLYCRNNEKPTMVELYEIATAFQQKKNIYEAKFSVTANLFTSKKVIDRVGQFDATLKSGGDVEWGNRVYKNGFSLVYGDDVCVSHPARRTVKQLYAKTVRVMGGETALSSRQFRTFLQSTYHWVCQATPPVSNMLNIFRCKKLTGFRQKMKAAFILVLVKYIKLIEKIRLRSGGSPHR
ncbi:MAG: glycosyltransferase family 2 protein [Desulfobulbaceae bacterium]|nr:glycosyltransferase family 2 protein [Desulfobulbaceae bacterium]